MILVLGFFYSTQGSNIVTYNQFFLFAEGVQSQIAQ